MTQYTANDALKEALRQSERQLEAQQALASSADQRALALCAALIVVISLLIQNIQVDGASVFETISLTLLFAASVLAAFSAKPTRFYGSGGSASGFKPYISDDHAHLLIEQICERNDEYLSLNDLAIKRSALLTKIALFVAFIGLLAMYAETTGIVAWLFGSGGVTP